MLNTDGKYCCTEEQLEHADWGENAYNWVEDDKQVKEKHYDFECPYFREEKVQNFWCRKGLFIQNSKSFLKTET